MHRFAFSLLFTLAIALTLPAADWSQFRGPTGDGRADYIVLDFETGAMQVWRNNGMDVPGGGGWLPMGQMARGAECPYCVLRSTDRQLRVRIKFNATSCSASQARNLLDNLTNKWNWIIRAKNLILVE